MESLAKIIESIVALIIFILCLAITPLGWITIIILWAVFKS